MDKIKFNNSSNIYDAVVIHVSDNLNVLGLKFDNSIDISPDVITSGFYLLNENNHEIMGDYSSYVNLYRNCDNTVYLSNDGSVYAEPEPTPEPEPYIPTTDEIRAQKISEMSSLCNMNIVNGVTFSVDGEAESFSYDHNDQTNIREAFDIALTTKTPMYYHSNNNAKKLYSVEQIIELYYRQFIHKMHHTIYYNQLKMYINTLDDRKSIENVEYGQKLTGEYLSNYNSAMEQSKNGIKALLKNHSYGHVIQNLELTAQ